MRVSELFEEAEPLVLVFLKKLLADDKTVYLDAKSRTEKHGNNFLGFHNVRKAYEGRIHEVRQGNIVYDHNANRGPNDRTISNSFFMLEQPADDHYTIDSHDDGSFTLVDV
jgi:hypothetical protein